VFAVAPPRLRLGDADVAKAGRAPSDFAAAGWSVASVVEGDLDQAGALDAVLVLERAPLPEDVHLSPEEEAVSERALVVLLQPHPGAYRRVGFSNTLIGCRSCGGAFWGSIPMSYVVNIEAGEFSVAQQYGSRWVTEIAVWLRYVAESDRVAVARYREHTYDRGLGGETTNDVHYVVKPESVREPDASGKSGTKKRRVTYARAFLEDVVFGEMP